MWYGEMTPGDERLRKCTDALHHAMRKRSAGQTPELPGGEKGKCFAKGVQLLMNLPQGIAIQFHKKGGGPWFKMPCGSLVPGPENVALHEEGCKKKVCKVTQESLAVANFYRIHKMGQECSCSASDGGSPAGGID